MILHHADAKTRYTQSREGVSLILGLLRQSRLQPMVMGLRPGGFDMPAFASIPTSTAEYDTIDGVHEGEDDTCEKNGPLARLSSWLRSPWYII